MAGNAFCDFPATDEREDRCRDPDLWRRTVRHGNPRVVPGKAAAIYREIMLAV